MGITNLKEIRRFTIHEEKIEQYCVSHGACCLFSGRSRWRRCAGGKEGKAWNEENYVNTRQDQKDQSKEQKERLPLYVYFQ